MSEADKKNPEVKDNESLGFEELTEEEINSSSVFSKPNIEPETRKKPKKQKNVVLRTALALVMVAALIAATLFINKYFGKSVGSSGSTGSVVSSTSSSDNTISVTKHSTADISKVSVKNAYGEIVFYPGKSSTDSDSDGEADAVWYIEGISKKYIDTENTDLTVGDCAEPKALLKREFDESFNYGFDDPDATATVTLKNKGESYTFTVGKKFQNSEMSGAYLKISTDPKNVYILSGETADYYTKDTVYYIQNNAPTKIEETRKNSKYFGSELDSFDYIELTGRNVKEDYKFTMYGRENSTVLYKMVSPYKYNVDSTNFQSTFEIIKTDLETSEVYYFNKKGVPASILKEYNLDDPDAVLTYKVGPDTVQIKLSQSKTDKSYYSMTVNDGPAIYKVTRLSFDFLEYDYTRFVASSMLLEDITGLSKVDIKIDGKTYGFNLKTTKSSSSSSEASADSTDSADDEEVTTTVKYDGKTIDSEIFSNYYYYILAVNPYVSYDSLKHSRPSGATEYFTVTMKHSASVGDPDTTLSVYKLKGNTARYYIELDSEPVGLCETQYADMVYDNISKVITNSEIKAIS